MESRHIGHAEAEHGDQAGECEQADAADDDGQPDLPDQGLGLPQDLQVAHEIVDHVLPPSAARAGGR